MFKFCDGLDWLKIAMVMRRKLMKSETVAKSKFYLNFTNEVLNNTIATGLTWQLSLLVLNKNAVQLGLKDAKY